MLHSLSRSERALLNFSRGSKTFTNCTPKNMRILHCQQLILADEIWKVIDKHTLTKLDYEQKIRRKITQKSLHVSLDSHTYTPPYYYCHRVYVMLPFKKRVNKKVNKCHASTFACSALSVFYCLLSPFVIVCARTIRVSEWAKRGAQKIIHRKAHSLSTHSNHVLGWLLPLVL